MHLVDKLLFDMKIDLEHGYWLGYTLGNTNIKHFPPQGFGLNTKIDFHEEIVNVNHRKLQGF